MLNLICNRVGLVYSVCNAIQRTNIHEIMCISFKKKNRLTSFDGRFFYMYSLVKSFLSARDHHGSVFLETLWRQLPKSTKKLSSNKTGLALTYLLTMV